MTQRIPLIGGPYCGESYTCDLPPGDLPPALQYPFCHGDHTRLYTYELATFTLACQVHPSQCPAGYPRRLHRYHLAQEELPS